MLIGIQEILVLLSIILFLILLQKIIVGSNTESVKKEYVIHKKFRFFIVFSIVWFLIGGSVTLHWFGEKYTNFIFIIVLPIFILWGALWIFNNKK